MQTENLNRPESNERAHINNAGNGSANSKLFEEFAKTAGGERNQLQPGTQNVGQAGRPEEIGAKMLDMLRAKSNIEVLGFGKCTIDMDAHTVKCDNVAIINGIKPGHKNEQRALPESKPEVKDPGFLRPLIPGKH
jgi:hypothetical protein